MASPLGAGFLQSGRHFGGNLFIPMIGFLRSNHINCHLEDGVWEVAIYIGHQGSMKGKAWVPRSYLYLHDIYILE